MAAKPNPVPGYPPGYSKIPEQTIPAGLELLQAHIYFRHGERTPVKERLTHLGIPSEWNLCKTAREFAVSVINDDKSGKELMLRRTQLERPAGTNPQPRAEGACVYGELTDMGHLSTLRLGQQLRSLYVDKLHLLPSNIGPQQSSSIYLRSTFIPRALTSMENVLHGFIPHQDPGFVPTVYQRSWAEESLLPNTTCPLFRKLDRQHVDKTAEELDERVLKPLDDKIAKLVGTPVRIKSSPAASGVMDTIRASQAHYIPVPKEFEDPKVVDTLESAMVQEWFGGYISKQFSRLAMGRLFGELDAHLDAKAKNADTPLKLGLYACHDVTVAGILSVLGAFDDKWPYFTAWLSCEMFRRAPEPSTSSSWPSLLFRFKKPDLQNDYYIRVKYNSEDVRIPACAAEGKHLPGSDGTVCTYQAFKDAVKDSILTHEQWVKECQQPMPDL